MSGSEAAMTGGRFGGRVAIVTGAGSGIGRAVTLRLVEEGAAVVASDVSEERLQSVVADTGSATTPVTGDIAQQAVIDEIVRAARAVGSGRIDVLANVAGIMDGFLPVHEVDDATWERVLAVNVTAPMRLTRAVVPSMIEASGGAIVNVASEAALRGSAAGVAYTTSKHALIGLTKSTAVLYGASGIRCNAVCPGAVATNIEAASRSEFGMTTIGKYFGNIPSVATAEQLAATICWLASADAANVNGAVVPSDGGWSAI